MIFINFILLSVIQTQDTICYIRSLTYNVVVPLSAVWLKPIAFCFSSSWWVLYDTWYLVWCTNAFALYFIDPFPACLKYVYRPAWTYRIAKKSTTKITMKLLWLPVTHPNSLHMPFFWILLYSFDLFLFKIFHIVFLVVSFFSFFLSKLVSWWVLCIWKFRYQTGFGRGNVLELSSSLAKIHIFALRPYSPYFLKLMIDSALCRYVQSYIRFDIWYYITTGHFLMYMIRFLDWFLHPLSSHSRLLFHASAEC